MPDKSFKHICVLVVSMVMVGCTPPITNGHSTGKTIVCLGASLTLGIGADKGHDYPSLLSQKVNVPVVNAGVDNDTTWEELQRLDADALSKDPKMVIITMRCNDLRHGMSKQDTLNNMEAIVDMIHSRGAMAVLVTFENKEFQDVYAGAFEKFARAKHILLVKDIIKGLDQDPRYMHDAVHPNNRGYAIVAERIYKRIRPFLK